MTTATDERLRAAAIRLGSASCSSAPGPGASRRAGSPGCGPSAAPRTVTSTSTPRSRASRRPGWQARPVGLRRPDHPALGEAAHGIRGRGRPVRLDDRPEAGRGRDPRRRLRAASSGEHAVLSFAATVDVIRPLVSDTGPAVVAERLLRLRGHGVTRLADALNAAREQLAQARARRQVVILLSDCRSTDDDDTVETARSLPELVILAPADDHEQAAHLANLSGAQWGTIAHPLDAARDPRRPAGSPGRHLSAPPVRRHASVPPGPVEWSQSESRVRSAAIRAMGWSSMM